MAFEDILYLFRSDVKNRYYVRLNLKEAGLLFKAASAAPGNVLEIGTKIGGSAVLLASAIGNRKVYSVDLVSHTSVQSYQKGRLGRQLDKMTPPELLNKIDFVIGDSVKVARRWSEEMGLIFIDGEHSPAALSKDIAAWNGHVKPGGFMAFHDVGVAGTQKGMKLAKKLAKVVKRSLPSWIKFGHEQSLLVLKKPE